MFGGQKPASASGVLFSGGQAGQAQGAAGGGLFGGANNQAGAAGAQGAGGLFGQKPAGSGGLFGGAGQVSGAATGTQGGLFGQKPAASGGLFGAGGATGGTMAGAAGTGAAGGGLFGQKPAAGGGLFGGAGGQVSGAAAGTQAGLFGQKPAVSGAGTGALFGGNPGATGVAGGAAAGGGLFGGNPGAASGLGQMGGGVQPNRSTAGLYGSMIQGSLGAASAAGGLTALGSVQGLAHGIAMHQVSALSGMGNHVEAARINSLPQMLQEGFVHVQTVIDKNSTYPNVISEKIKNFKKDVEDLSYETADVIRASKGMDSKLKRAEMFVDRLKTDMISLLHTTEETGRLFESFKRSVPIPIPSQFFVDLVTEFIKRIQVYQQRLGEAEEMINIQIHAKEADVKISPQLWVQTIQQMYQVFMLTASEVASLHERVKELKQVYVRHMKSRYGETNIEATFDYEPSENQKLFQQLENRNLLSKLETEKASTSSKEVTTSSATSSYEDSSFNLRAIFTGNPTYSTHTPSSLSASGATGAHSTMGTEVFKNYLSRGTPGVRTPGLARNVGYTTFTDYKSA